jgi:hypothetical protein
MGFFLWQKVYDEFCMCIASLREISVMSAEVLLVAA